MELPPNVVIALYSVQLHAARAVALDVRALYFCLVSGLGLSSLLSFLLFVGGGGGAARHRGDARPRRLGAPAAGRVEAADIVPLAVPRRVRERLLML